MGKAPRAKETLKPLPKRLPPCDDIVVALLTGGRPSLLERTIASLVWHAGSRARRWRWIALVNGGDDASLKVLRARSWIQVESCPGPIQRIGPAISQLMRLVVATDARFVLHLEDDWGCRDDPSAWLDRAAFALQDPKLGQVRMRLASEKVMKTSMTTGSRIKWRHAPDHMRSSNAHLTFNPNLMRLADCAQVFPCDHEPDAQLRFARLGLNVVQLVPGAFTHLGDMMSLRGSLRNRKH